MQKRPVPKAEFATLTQRLVAHFIDGCIMLALVLAFVILAATVEGVSEFLAKAAKGMGVVTGVGYRLVVDGLMRGQGIGKRRVGIRVVDAASGAPCAVWQCLVRTLMLFAPFISLLDVMLLLVNKRERLGDRVARTQVVQGNPPLPKVRRRISRTAKTR